MTEAEREYNRKYHLERYHRLRAEWVAALGGQCVKCGSMEGLQFDHKDPATKSFNLSEGWGRPAEETAAELAKCQLLCGEHHRKKTSVEQRVEVHGTWGMYKNRKCRCQVCRDFVNQYFKEWKRARRRNTGEVPPGPGGA